MAEVVVARKDEGYALATHHTKRQVIDNASLTRSALCIATPSFDDFFLSWVQKIATSKQFFPEGNDQFSERVA